MTASHASRAALASAQMKAECRKALAGLYIDTEGSPELVLIDCVAAIDAIKDTP